jgi:FkbM family methyltransferase
MYAESKDRETGLVFIKGGLYEPYETELFKKSIKKGMIIVDVGAHIGYYTLLAARLTGNTGKVFAFEPDPYNFAILKRNVSINGYRNVILEQKAVLDQSVACHLFLCRRNLGAHRIYDVHDGRKKITVEGTTLDEYFRAKPYIDVIKIDVEGAEAAVIQGMDNIISTNKRLKMFLEFWPAGERASGFSPTVFLNKLFKYCYRIYFIDESKKEVVRMMNEAEVFKSIRKDSINLLLEKFC